jgi:hypothetical protein
VHKNDIKVRCVVRADDIALVCIRSETPVNGVVDSGEPGKHIHPHTGGFDDGVIILLSEIIKKEREKNQVRESKNEQAPDFPGEKQNGCKTVLHTQDGWGKKTKKADTCPPFVL